MAPEGPVVLIERSVLRRRTRPEEIDHLLRQTYASDARSRSAAVHALCPCSLQAEHDRVRINIL